MKKLLVFFLIIGIGATFWLYHLYSSSLKYSLNPDSANRVSVNIPEGSTGKSIAQILKEAELIKSEMVFNFYLKQNGLADQLKAGQYAFKENQKLPEIVALLAEGGMGEVSVTLLEGWTIKQMADYLEDQNLVLAEDFLECIEKCNFDFNFLPDDHLEGYLYPDTYFIDRDSFTSQAFINRLLQNFKTRLTDGDWEAINASDRDFEDIMIIASIVEREESLEEEKPTVAGILWNRLDQGMRLDADATVLYALGRTEGGLTREDLEIDSPYNTRKNLGLPPTPISNPSIESIRAALYPDETSYLYYLHDEEGNVHYAKTLEGHNQNKANHLN